jgi:hypothetical protein
MQGFHYLNIITTLFIDDKRASEIENYDTEHCLGWEWIPWADYITRKDLYNTLEMLIEAGYTDLNEIKKHPGCLL